MTRLCWPEIASVAVRSERYSFYSYVRGCQGRPVGRATKRALIMHAFAALSGASAAAAVDFTAAGLDDQWCNGPTRSERTQTTRRHRHATPLSTNDVANDKQPRRSCQQSASLSVGAVHKASSLQERWRYRTGGAMSPCGLHRQTTTPTTDMGGAAVELFVVGCQSVVYYSSGIKHHENSANCRRSYTVSTDVWTKRGVSLIACDQGSLCKTLKF